MKRFRETGSMLKDPSKGSSLRRDLGEGASNLKTAFKKIKDAGKSLSRGTKDLSATRVIQGPKTKQLSSPTAREAGNKLIQTGKAAPKPKLKTFTSNDLIGTEGMSAGEIVKRGPQGEPKRRPNESMTVYRQRLAKYRRENK